MEKTPAMFQVSLRTLLEITALVAFLLAIWFVRAENKNGRYEMTVEGPSSRVHVIDSKTGQVWQHGDNGWNQLTPLPVP